MKIKTSELIGPALDWAVAVCNGRGLDLEDPRDPWLTCGGIADQPLHSYTPHTDWSQGGPIIERESITLRVNACVAGHWAAFIDFGSSTCNVRARQSGRSPLTAAMRCYVASKLGDEVDVPEELV